MTGPFNDLIEIENVVVTQGITLSGYIYPVSHPQVEPAHVLHCIFKITPEQISLGSPVKGRKRG